MEEVWLPVVGYEGLYEVSNTGKIKSVDRYIACRNNGKRFIKGVVLNTRITACGYEQVLISKNNICKGPSVHKLMMEAFVPNPDNLPCVNHKDEVKTHNFIYVNPDGSVDQEKSNLEWCNYGYNNRYGTRIKKASDKKKKPVFQYSLEGNFIDKWKSVKEAEDTLKISHISDCCIGKRKTAGDFKWKYE